MTHEDFEAWHESPVTQWVLKALEGGAAAQEAAWASCLTGDVKPGADLGMLRIELRTRADAYRALAQASYEDFCSLNGEEPKES